MKIPNVMKSPLLAILVLLFCFKSVAQNKETKELENFLATNNIEISKPTPLSGYQFFRDCTNGAVYKKTSGDTIVFYSSAHSIAQNLETFKETATSEGFNTLMYPIYFQDNATVVVQYMKKEIFLIRNDTLYLFDNYDPKKIEAQLKLMSAKWSEKITESEYAKKIKAVNSKDYGATPKFKVIYFKGIFENSNTYKFSEKQNHLKESVHLDDKWVQNNKECFKINLKTHTNGRYILSEDMVFLNYENCQIDTRSRLNNN